jgi:UDP-GlcNAc:undecaprenyl-phosphate GlcNAc-1-phosphate transferase
VPVTVLVIVGLSNAINMVDGLDGLAAGVSLTSLAWMLVAAVLTGASAPSGLPILIAAVGGFMLLNSRHPFNTRAAAFLGDSGSMVLGVCLGWYAITLSQGVGARRKLSSDLR